MPPGSDPDGGRPVAIRGNYLRRGDKGRRLGVCSKAEDGIGGSRVAEKGVRRVRETLGRRTSIPPPDRLYLPYRTVTQGSI